MPWRAALCQPWQVAARQSRDLEGLTSERLATRMKTLGRLIGRDAVIRIVDPAETTVAAE